MSSMDLYEDGFPHGTKEGFERGCRGGACPNKLEGEMICRDAAMRYARDYAYRRAIDNGETPPPEFPDTPTPAKTSKAFPHAEERIYAEPTITVADTIVEPDPIEPAGEVADELVDEVPAELEQPKRRGRPPRADVTHPSPAMYQRGCRRDHECPSHLAGGISCRRAALDHKRDLAAAKRAAEKAAEPTFADRVEAIVAAPVEVPAAAVEAPPVETVEVVPAPAPEAPATALLALTSDPAVECTVTAMPNGGLVVVIRIPAQVVAA